MMIIIIYASCTSQPMAGGDEDGNTDHMTPSDYMQFSIKMFSVPSTALLLHI